MCSASLDTLFSHYESIRLMGREEHFNHKKNDGLADFLVSVNEKLWKRIRDTVKL